MAEANITVTINVNADEFEELRRDAERYRWLRRQHWIDAKVAVITEPRRNVLLGSYLPHGLLLDEVIDKERSKT